MAESICASFRTVAKRLKDLGLGYLALDRASSTLSTGERQRMQLARAVRNRTTGVLYVLDEPSIGLHPANITGLVDVMRDLVADGNSVILVDHDAQILGVSDWIIEMGPGAGEDGGTVIAQGTVPDIVKNPASRIGPFLASEAHEIARSRADGLFADGALRLSTGAIHTVKPLEVVIPKGRLTVVTGVSGSGKTTLVLESLVPALEAYVQGGKPPEHIVSVDAPGRERALYRGDVRQRARRAAQNLRAHAGREGARLQGGGFFVQYGQAPLPRMRRHGHDQSGRAVPARRGHSVPRVPRHALCQRNAVRSLRVRRRE